MIRSKLQEAESSVREAEAEAEAEAQVLLDITDKINARASYSLSVGGTCPDLLLLNGTNDFLSSHRSTNDSSNSLYPNKKQRTLHLLQAHHPLLVQSHQHSLEEARKNVLKSTSMGLELYFQFRRRKMQTENIAKHEFAEVDPKKLQDKVTQLEKARPTPVDFKIDNDARVVLISGPNMGGKTVCLKTLGLSAIMAKAGLYILSSEPAKIPWFDYVLYLSHSLSTFSGHLKQISIGAGTNPLEGTALGMSILESFSVSGALLTVGTTHHGELNTLKYCNEAFENACMEYDEVHLKPTYKILWGVPGRSKAINIAERLGMLEIIVSNARKLYGAASAEIDEVIFASEKSRQDVEEYVRKAHLHLMLSKDIRGKLLLAQRKLTESRSKLHNKKMQQISEITTRARSTLLSKTKMLHSKEKTAI